jgi:predicted transcriptional regulator YdeE
VAGITGSGDETGKAWEAFMKLDKINPLKNKVGEEGYEVRMYPAEGPGKIHVGVEVKDASVPKEYKLFFVPAATYAEFEIYPSKGYESSNAEMSKWLQENANTYKEAFLDGMHYAIEVYDKRYKGDKDQKSVVGIWMPIVPAVPEDFMLKMFLGPLEEISRRIEQFAGAAVSKKAMQGKDEILAAKDPVKGALWMKEVIDRLDALTDKKTREKIMTACGHNCIAHNSRMALAIKARRQKFTTEEEFLKAEAKKPVKGTCIELRGNILVQYYTPHTSSTPRRCFCGLMFALPEDVNASPTYCQCSRGFVEKYWESALGRPVLVEVEGTAITGSDECKFIIHL